MTSSQRRSAGQGADAARGTASNAPLTHHSAHSVLDLDRYIPFLVSAIGNKWSRSSSRIYLDVFGVGVTEWRIMAMLAIEPRITAYRICQVIGLDKAAASRSLKVLEQRRFVSSHQEAPQNHRKIVELTQEGWQMHDRIIRLAHEREAKLLADLSREEVEELAEYLRRILRRVPDILTHGENG